MDEVYLMFCTGFSIGSLVTTIAFMKWAERKTVTTVVAGTGRPYKAPPPPEYTAYEDSDGWYVPEVNRDLS